MSTGSCLPVDVTAPSAGLMISTVSADSLSRKIESEAVAPLSAPSVAVAAMYTQPPAGVSSGSWMSTPSVMLVTAVVNVVSMPTSNPPVKLAPTVLSPRLSAAVIANTKP